ncbi:MAG: TetR/AcrR family transcriptional regulator [Streptosporangiaceae bacterium]
MIGQQNAGRRPRNRRGQGGRLREELIEAARRLLATAEREADVSIRAVTREARTAPQSFYLQFASLDELLYAVYALEYEQLRQAMAQAASQAPDPQARLAAVCTAYCQYAQEQPGRYRALTGIRGQPRHPGWDGHPLPGAPAFAMLRDTAAQALAAAGSTADPFLAASTLWAGLHGLITLRASRPAFPWPPLADMIDAIAGQTLRTP